MRPPLSTSPLRPPTPGRRTPGRRTLGRLAALLGLLLCAVFALGAPPAAPDGEPGTAPVAGALAGAESERWFALERLNAGLESVGAPLDLRAPQSAVATLVTLVREGEAERAAHALNLNLLPVEEQAARGPELARRLVWLLDRRRLIAWDELSDRPDGAGSAAAPASPAAPVAAGAGERGAPAPRRSLLLGGLRLDEREVELRLQRVRVAEGEPRWVVSAGTVEWIDPLYRVYGPDVIDRWMPDWARRRLLLEVPLWEWGALLLLGALALALGRVTLAVARRAAGRGRTRLLAALANPLGWLAAALLLFTATNVDLPLTGAVLAIARPVTWLLLIAALTWLAIRASSELSSRFEQRHLRRLARSEGDSAARTRQHRTALSIVRRAGVAVVLLVGIGIALSQFAQFGRLGATLLSSAGILSVVIGIAAQPVLGNLAAGLQIAVTQPLRIGDSVYLHDTWGYVEELGYTFAVIRSWDQRRLLIPLRRLVTEPYENWTLTDSHLIKPVYLHADPSVDVAAVRRRFAELLRDDPDYDGVKEPTLQVTATTEWTVVLRALCSAADPSTAWALHCRMREALVAYLAELEGGRYLPRQRVEGGREGAGEGVEPPSGEGG